ncbi:hypothetical protein HZB05_01675 [Candidatus Wolfebacteria bacterium]|nr:hypothetical protein [Candidatus Wolfebacteria bacterium]
MAIILEEEKKKTNWGVILGLILVVVFVGAAVYYLFFVNPAQVQVFISPKLKVLSDFKTIQFSPDDLLNNPTFKALQPPSQEFLIPAPELRGKANPFLP